MCRWWYWLWWFEDRIYVRSWFGMSILLVHQDLWIHQQTQTRSCSCKWLVSCTWFSLVWILYQDRGVETCCLRAMILQSDHRGFTVPLLTYGCQASAWNASVYEVKCDAALNQLWHAKEPGSGPYFLEAAINVGWVDYRTSCTSSEDPFSDLNWWGPFPWEKTKRATTGLTYTLCTNQCCSCTYNTCYQETVSSDSFT